MPFESEHGVQSAPSGQELKLYCSKSQPSMQFVLSSDICVPSAHQAIFSLYMPYGLVHPVQWAV